MIQASAELEIEDTINGLRIALPKRDLSAVARFGWIGVAGAAVVGTFMFGWLAGPIWMMVDAAGEKNFWLVGFLSVFVLSGLFGLRFAYLLLRASLAVIKNDTRSDVWLQDGRLRVIEHFGGFKWQRKCKLPQVKRLMVRVARKSKRDSKALSLNDFPELVAFADEQAYQNREKIRNDDDPRTKERFLVVAGYDEAVLSDVAGLLAQRLDAKGATNAAVNRLVSGSTVGMGLLRGAARNDVSATRNDVSGAWHDDEEESSAESPEVKISIDRPSDDAEADGLSAGNALAKNPVSVQPPFNSRLTVERLGYATVITSTPAGFYSKQHPFGWIATFWLSITLIGCAMVIPATVRQDGWGGALPALGFAILFLATGIGLLIAALRIGSLSTTFGLSKETLWMKRKTLFGEKVQEIPTSEIQSIRSAASNVTVNDKRVNEIRVTRHDGTSVVLGMFFSEEEKRWIAGTLDQEIRSQQ